jgi:hypothetical protein
MVMKNYEREGAASGMYARDFLGLKSDNPLRGRGFGGR